MAKASAFAVVCGFGKIHGGWHERFARSVIKSAEGFVIDQPQYLNGDDKAFQRHDEEVAEDINRNASARSDHFRQCFDHQHHAGVAEDKSAYTHEGKGVGQIADGVFQQFEDVLQEISAKPLPV